jgi:hypothetical protein
MADGVATLGVTVATDDVTGLGHVQFLKLVYGSDGQATHVTPAAGLPVSLQVPDGLGQDVDVSRVQGVVEVNSELPVAALLGDADTATGLAPAVAGRLQAYDPTLNSGGGGFYRLRGDTSWGLDVDVQRVLGVVSVNDNGGSLTVDGGVALSQYAPADVDTGAGSENALPIALRLPGSGGAVTAPGDVTYGLDVDVSRVQGTVTVAVTGAVDTELPAAVLLADGLAMPTTPLLGAALLGYDDDDNTLKRVAVAAGVEDGATGANLLASALTFFNGSSWDRVRGSTSHGLVADIARLPRGAALDHANLNVGVTASTVAAADLERKAVTIQPINGDIYIGGPSVTTANGIYVPRGGTWEERDFTGDIWAIAVTGTVDVRRWSVT